MTGSGKDAKNEWYRHLYQLGALTTIPIILLSGPLVGFFIGRWLDRKFNINNTLTMLFTALGFAAAAKETIRLVKSAAKDESKN